jgi:hypothetical protein
MSGAAGTAFEATTPRAAAAGRVAVACHNARVPIDHSSPALTLVLPPHALLM